MWWNTMQMSYLFVARYFILQYMWCIIAIKWIARTDLYVLYYMYRALVFVKLKFSNGIIFISHWFIRSLYFDYLARNYSEPLFQKILTKWQSCTFWMAVPIGSMPLENWFLISVKDHSIRVTRTFATAIMIFMPGKNMDDDTTRYFRTRHSVNI